MRFRIFASVVVSLVCLQVRPLHAREILAPPVDAVIVEPFEGPDAVWGPGHRGIDYSIASGTSVRAAAAGTVTFAGRVPGGYAVTIDHGVVLESTYSLLSEVHVRAGDLVAEGTWIGVAGVTHAGGDEGLHFGVKAAGEYVDPMLHLVPIDAAGAIALAPLDLESDDRERRCNPSGELPEDLPPPNDNIAVVVGGITSSTAAPPHLFETVDRLGYPSDRIFRFSYRGTDGRALHEPYEPDDTYGDIHTAAERLGDLLEKIAARYPGAQVDLLAHSQGGIVSRAYLQEQTRVWNDRQPRVAHLVTFSSPHRGAPAAGELDAIRNGPFLSRRLVDGLERVSDLGLPVPPPSAPSIRQLAPGSELMTSLARQDISYGTRVLALAMPNDVVVPQDSAIYPGKPGIVVPSSGLFGHSEIMRSSRALQIARAFLAGAGPACDPELGFVDSHLGGVIEGAQSSIAEFVNTGAEAIKDVLLQF